MSWFDEQLRSRKEADDRRLDDSVKSIARAVMGQKLAEALSRGERTQTAVEEILKYYHYKPKELPESIRQDSLEKQLEYRLRPFGITYRPVVLDSDWYRRTCGPMIGILKEDDSAVALLPGAFFGYYFHDPKTGKRKYLNKNTEKLFVQDAICFYKPLPQKALTMLDLLRFALEQCTAWDYVLYVGSIGISSALGLLTPMFTKWLFGDVLNSGSGQMLLSLAAFMICFSLCQACYSVFQNLLNARLNTKQNIAVQAAVMNRIMSLPVTFFRQYSAGELQQRAGYVQELTSLLLSTIGATGLTSAFSLIYLGQIFAFAPLW